jgi:hypothetical protein
MSNRKEAQAFILKYIDKIMPGSENSKIYSDLFSSMDDKAFDQFMDDIDKGIKTLAIIAPNFGKESLSTERNLALAKEIGHNFFQRVWIEGDEDTPTYLTPIPYLVIDLPLRRQAQLLVKKISIPEDNKSVDDFTGQPTGKSKGARVSYPEVQVLAAMGLDNSLVELLKYRGGDVKGFDAMNDSISKRGGVSMAAIEKFTSGVESTRILKTFLSCMHIRSTLNP